MKKYKFWTKDSEILQVQKTVIGWRQKKKKKKKKGVGKWAR